MAFLSTYFLYILAASVLLLFATIASGIYMLQNHQANFFTNKSFKGAYLFAFFGITTGLTTIAGFVGLIAYFVNTGMPQY